MALAIFSGGTFLYAVAMQRLQAGGVVIERHDDCPHGRFCWCRDAEGNVLEIWEPV